MPTKAKTDAAFLPFYRALSQVATRLAPALARGFAATLAQRHGAVARWRAHAAAGARGAIWLHAASVGEALTVVPIVRRLRAARPGTPFVLTHTSRAAAQWPGDWGVDYADYLPLDAARPMEAMLEALAPPLLVLSRADVWPELVAAALRRGIPVAQVGATVSPRSARLRWPICTALRPLYAGLAYVGAVSQADRARLRRLGVRDRVLDVTGDPRHDQVLERIPDLRPVRPLIPWAAGAHVLVAGSTDARDAALLLEALAALRRSHPAARLLLCPHEPNPDHTARLLALAHHIAVPAATWRGDGGGADGPPHEAACLVMEQVGVLADLYTLGHLSYVGGGFGRLGVHAVIEPAAYALPTIIGPRGLTGDARALLEAGGAISLPSRGAKRALGACWQSWLVSDDTRVRAGLAARGVLSSGAADRTAACLLELVAQ
jgi:3-deoxy-D-manno-octulosonic-acid transferase